MFFDSVLHRYFSLANVDLTAFTGNPLNPPSCLAGSTAFFGLTRCDLKKSPTWKQRVCFVVLGRGCCSSFSEVWVRWKRKNFDVANSRLEYKFCSPKASGKWLSTLEKFYLKFPLCITNLERFRQTTLLPFCSVSECWVPLFNQLNLPDLRKNN